MKSYLTFINESKLSDLSTDKDWQVKIIKDTIDKINKHPDKILLRKSNNYINNIVFNSELCKMYRSYHNSIGEKIKSIPVPKSIYDLEDIFIRIDEEILKEDEAIYKTVLRNLKNYLVWISYFPNIIEYRNKYFLPHFKITLLDYLRKPLNKEDILYNQGIVIHHLFTANSHDEIRTERFIEDIERDLDYIERVNRNYQKWYIKNIEYKPYIEQLDNFESFLNKYNWYLDGFFGNDYVNPTNIYILKHEDAIKKNIKLMFIGDFKTDYINFTKCYKKYYEN